MYCIYFISIYNINVLNTYIINMKNRWHRDVARKNKRDREVKELDERIRRKIKIIKEQLKYMKEHKYPEEEIAMKKARLKIVRDSL